MKHFVFVSAAIVFLAGCSENHTADYMPTTPPSLDGGRDRQL
jgi:hypothetical protein